MRRLLAAAIFAAASGAASAESQPVLAVVAGEEALAFGAADIAGIETAPSGLSILLSEAAAIRFAGLTRGAVGRTLTVSVCGEVLISARVQAEIDSGVLVARMESPEASDLYADILRGDMGCDGTRAD